MNVLTVPNGIVVALFGIVLSASFCDICWTKRNRIVLVAGTAVILLLQGAITFGASWDAMQELYPFTTHLPLAAVGDNEVGQLGPLGHEARITLAHHLRFCSIPVLSAPALGGASGGRADADPRRLVAACH